MAKISLGCFILAYALVFILMYSQVKADLGEGCKGNWWKFAIACKNAIMLNLSPINPSEECCVQFRDTDIACYCRRIFKYIENIVSVEKVAHVAKYCQRPLESGSKCGSYTVPKD
ncbi:uncharacterized protein LOC109831331 [Asparagus officinalis]|uniref:uncharacterized protein LOC109831331 n=1 Tax=Asparagus officinalis TaxID=4686 RepID=UPI00098E0575|nr:uncharacterized protein LOC109831331 [Asparagus officinalis]